MDSNCEVQTAQNNGSAGRTAKVEPILEGRGWTVQRKVVRLEQQPYTLPDLKKLNPFQFRHLFTQAMVECHAREWEAEVLDWTESIIQAEEAVAG